MARQQDSCWRCRARWASEDAPPPTLRAIAGGLLGHPFADLTRAETRHDDDRRTTDGSGVGSEVTAGPPRAVAARR